VIETGVEGHDLDTQRLQDLRRERAGGSVAAGDHRLHLARQARPVGQVLEVDLEKVLDEAVAPATLRLEGAGQDDVLEAAHLLRPERQGPLRSHLHARPAVVVVGRRHHGDRRHIEGELGEIGHGREGEADVVDRAASRHQPLGQRDLDGHGIAPEIVPDHDLPAAPDLSEQRAEAHAQRLDAHEIQFRSLVRTRMPEPPAGIVLPEARRLDQWRGLEGQRVDGQVGLWLGEHEACPEVRNGSLLAHRARKGIRFLRAMRP
jgi:hypothetical protein